MKFSEAFYTMGKSEDLLVSVYVNPSSSEIKRYVPFGARAYIDVDGNLYVEGYEEHRQKYSQVLHSVLLELIKDKNPSLFPDVNSVWGIGSCEYGVCVQFGEDSKNEVYVGESHRAETLNFDGVHKIFEKCKQKNPHLYFVEKIVINQDESRYGDLRSAVTPIKEKRAHLSENFFTMGRVKTDYGGSFLMSVYVNPTPTELKQNVALGARAFIDKNGNLYMEGYEPEENEGQVVQSRILHGALLDTIFEVNPNIFPSEISSKRELADHIWFDYTGRFGVCVQRDEDNPGVIKVAESASFGAKVDTAKITSLFMKAHAKNPTLMFSIESMVFDVRKSGSLPSDAEAVREEVGTVAAADFGSEIPGDQRHAWKSDGAVLNRQSRTNLKKLGITLQYAGEEPIEERVTFLFKGKKIPIKE